EPAQQGCGQCSRGGRALWRWWSRVRKRMRDAGPIAGRHRVSAGATSDSGLPRGGAVALARRTDRALKQTPILDDRTRRSTDLLALIAFCGFLFFAGLQVIGLVGADEPRYAQIAREMLQRGDWVTPVLGGQPWLQKPPLFYWATMLAYK